MIRAVRRKTRKSWGRCESAFSEEHALATPPDVGAIRRIIKKIGQSFVYFGVFVVSACSVGDQSALTNKQLHSVFLGNSFYYEGPFRGAFYSGVTTFTKAGSLDVRTDSGTPDGGVWFIETNKLCLRLLVVANGETVCVNVSQDGTNFRTSNGIGLKMIVDE